MRLYNFITETEEVTGNNPEDNTKDKKPEEDPKVKDMERIVDMVKAATDKNGMNSAVKTAAPLYKEYGEDWLKQLKKALSVDIVSDVVDRFITITKNFSEKLTHLK